MRAKALHTRDDLLRRLQCPTTACERALRDDIVTVIGGFTPPGDLPFFLVRIKSARGKEWYVGLRVDEENIAYRPFWYDDPMQVPWQHWAGHPQGRNPIRDGDIPLWCSYRKECAEAHERSLTTQHR